MFRRLLLLPLLFLCLGVMHVYTMPGYSATDIPDVLLGFGRNSTKADMIAKLGDHADVSGNRSTYDYYYQLSGGSSLRFSFNEGDSRIQAIVLSYWPSEEADTSELRKVLEGYDLPTAMVDWLHASQAELESEFGVAPGSEESSWKQYAFENGGYLEFYLGGEPPRVSDITLNFGYSDVPAEFVAPVAEPAAGREPLEGRGAFFGLTMGVTQEQLKTIRGEPKKIEAWSEDYPDWHYTNDNAEITVVASMSKVGEFDAEYDEHPGAFLLNRVSIDLPYIDNVRDLDAARMTVRNLGWEDPLLDTLGMTRSEIRALYGDPASYSGYNWGYEVPAPDWTIAIDFRFTGSSDAARCTGFSISRW